MKLTKLPDGTVQVEGTPEEVRALLAPPEDAIGKMLPQAPLATGQCICGQPYWSVVPPWCPVHGRVFRYSVQLNAAACAPNLGQCWIGEVKAGRTEWWAPAAAAANPMTPFFQPLNAGASA